MRRRLGGAALCLTTLVMLVAPAWTKASEPPPVGVTAVGAPASAHAVAVRLDRWRPVPGEGCEQVIVIGDSLTVGSRPDLVKGLNARGIVHLIDGMNSRRIPKSAPAPYSGVTAALDARATFGEAECWVVALGSNDLIQGAGTPATAQRLIDEMLAAVTPGAWVGWVNVNYRPQVDSPYDFVGATARFNQALADRAARTPGLTVIDWYSLSAANSSWFADHVHVSAVGSAARATQILRSLDDV